MQVPAQVEYEKASSVEHALGLLARYAPGARVLAGGHSLIPMMKLRLAQPEAAPRMQDALVGLDDALSDQIAWLENAAADDRADAEDSGEAERERQAWRPLRAA